MSEGRSRAQRLAEQRRTEDDLSQLTSHWQTTVLPCWSSQANTKKTRALWWRGLPPPVRGRVWRLALPNTLNLTAQLYHILVSRAREQLERPGPAQGDNSREETLELIRLDVSRTFPQLCIFQEGGPYFQLLHNVLGAYVCYRPDIGYVQVTNCGSHQLLFIIIIAGDVLHSGYSDPQHGRGRCFHNVCQPAKLAPAGSLFLHVRG